jgi:hypothetical protein
MVGEIRYQSGGDNAILRLALYEAYGGKCRSCGIPLDFAQVEIDHLVPRTTTPEGIAKLVHADRAKGYDLDAVYNLAPTCKRCNGKKSNRDLSRYLALASALEEAWAKREIVIRKAKSFEGPNAIAKFLTTIAAMDFEDADNRAMFEEHMPTLVRSLAAMNPEKAQEFDELRTVWVDDPAQEGRQLVLVTLNLDSRKSMTVFEDVCDLSLDDALLMPVRELRHEIIESGKSSLEHHEFKDRNEIPDVDYLDGDIDINIDRIDWERSGNYFSFTFCGVFDSYLSGGVAVASVDGGDLEALQGDVFGNGRFSVTASWELGDPDCQHVGDAFIDDWQASTSIW